MIIRLAANVVRSGERMALTLEGLTEEQVREPSGLAGCSRGWVASHVVRSVEAYQWLLGLAATGTEPGPRLSGAEIGQAVEAGAGRSGAVLADELRGRLGELAGLAGELSQERWEYLVTALAGWRHPAWYTLYRCWREFETHHADLAAGYGPADWPEAYVRWALEDTLAALTAREVQLGVVEATDLGLRWETGAGPGLAAPGWSLLARLAGRSAEGPAIELPAWPLPPAPGWG
ncbi:maleylpyruvate isomerase family mycothiol-dependent enzyme [Kitasatospora sp. NPDC002227]|uniref:maleylpyruvate isomerase family mycothiol-dependent enzyme n=1 Tax=Kitasatospora sp. NPDC002227 TaxID=3154773 RepID=UPI0033253A68